MSRKRDDQLLQECLAAYDAGLSPEECLSAFPEHRHVLEPLFRQALSLRFAYATRPRPEFVSSGRQTLLFAAGKDVSEVLNLEPDEDFVRIARMRFLNRAGATAQEALREVPPPRLPFWVNARRRLLETASRGPVATRRAPSPVLRLRAGLSAAAVALALAIGALAYLSTESNPTSVSAQIASIDQQLAEIEHKQQAGESIPTNVLSDLAAKTYELSLKLDNQVKQSDTQQLNQIIERQKPLIDTAVAADPSPPVELQQAQTQLIQAETRVLAARADTPVPATPTVVTAAVAPTATPVPPTVTPAATSTLEPNITPAPLAPNQVRITLVADDTTGDKKWLKISTTELNFLVPSDWTAVGLRTDGNGEVHLITDYFFYFFQNGDGAQQLIINAGNGEMRVTIDGGAVVLRAGGPDGASITLEALEDAIGGEAPLLWHVVQSLKLGPEPEPTDTPSETPSATPSVTPSVTPTADATATPTATPTRIP